MHRDEKTLHIHCVFVPITEDGRLSAKDYVDGKARLRHYQDAYGQAMQPLGLARGIPIEHTQAQHLSTAASYRSLHEMEQAVAKQLQGLHVRNGLGLPKAKAALQQDLILAHQQALEQRHKHARLTREYAGEQKRELARVKGQVNLIQHAASMGYKLNPTASCARYGVMEQAGDQVLIATRPNAAGHWVYHSAPNSPDRGTLVALMRHRGYSYRAISKLSSQHLDQEFFKAFAQLTQAKRRAQVLDSALWGLSL